MPRRARLLPTTTATRRNRRTPSPVRTSRSRAQTQPPNTPTPQRGQHKRPAARSASTTARSSATMSMTTSKGARRPPRLTPARFRRRRLQTTESPASRPSGHPAADPITTLGDANPPAVTTHHVAQHRGRAPAFLRSPMPAASADAVVPGGSRDGGGRAVWGPASAEKAGGEPFGDRHLPRRPAASRPRPPSIPPGATCGWIRGARSCSQLPIVPADPSNAPRPRLSII